MANTCSNKKALNIKCEYVKELIKFEYNMKSLHENIMFRLNLLSMLALTLSWKKKVDNLNIDIEDWD